MKELHWSFLGFILLSTIPASSPPTRKARPAMHATAAAVSHDGRRVLFNSMRDGPPDVYLMNLDGSGVRRAIGAPGTRFGPQWGPGTGEITFSSPHAGAGDSIDVVVATLDRLHQRVIATSADSPIPAVSPDAKRISYTTGVFPHNAVNVVNTDGTARQNLTAELGTASESTWSPNGQRILFISAVLDSATHKHWDSTLVIVMNPDGTNKRTMARFPGVGQRPAWSPDGLEIALQVADTALKDIQVFLIGTQTQRFRSITPHVAGKQLWDELPTWMPDSQHLIFTSDRDGTMELYSMEIDGSNQRRITF